MKKGVGVTDRMAALAAEAVKKGLDCVLAASPANMRALTGVDCGEGVLEMLIRPRGLKAALYTDFRYAPMIRRTAPGLEVRDIRSVGSFRPRGKRVGYESSLPHGVFLEWEKRSRGARFVDFSAGFAAVRAVKDEGEILRIKAAEELTCAIWEEASASFRPGMTELDMARLIRSFMVSNGDGEAFETIVCVGRNAAECHHVPDGTVWNGRESVLVDMGVKLDGVCSDLTRNILPKRIPRLYRAVYSTVLAANEAAIEAVKPGVRGRALDKVARDIIGKAGFGGAFGHSLGHGVGYEVHERPYASMRSVDVLEPGMVLTIEPGIYLEGNLGVRIEDLVLVTETGCEVLSRTAK